MSEEESGDSLVTRAQSYSKSETKMASTGKKRGDKEEMDGSEIIGVKKPVTDSDWWDVFNKMATAVAGVQMQLADLTKLKGKVSDYSTEWKKKVDQRVDDQAREGEFQDFRNKLLGNIIIKQDQRIKELESKVERMMERELRQNLIVHGLVKERNEKYPELVEIINKFLKEQLQIESDIAILDAYCLGNKPHDRPVRIRLQHQSDKSIIFANASNLKGKKNSKQRLFLIQDDQTERQAESRKYYWELIKESQLAKDNPDRKFTVSMSRGNIMINGHQKLKSKIQPAEPADIIRMDGRELEEVKAVKMVKGELYTEKLSEFISFVQVIKSPNDVNKGYAKLKIKYVDATHISCAYRLKNPNGPFDQDYLDDQEIGQGRNIL